MCVCVGGGGGRTGNNGRMSLGGDSICSAAWLLRSPDCQAVKLSTKVPVPPTAAHLAMVVGPALMVRQDGLGQTLACASEVYGTTV
jgi:hypothetical protein